MKYFVVVAAAAVILIVIAVVIIVAVLLKDDDKSGQGGGAGDSGFETNSGVWRLFEPEYKRAGRMGEAVATKVISRVLRDGDRLFTNISIVADGRPAEFDSVVVNRFGVFIIEVKNYNGYIVGEEDDYEWRKYKTTSAGNTYESSVKNPIKQVKRQVYLLAKYLRYFGFDIWVEGYAFLLQDNSPVDSKYLLRTPDDIDRAVHTKRRRMLSDEEIEEIARLIGGKA
ncbi:MAG: NERD domain-containing protein [Clostridia bacterium]|jgi:hypothetical protein|nr:NERD domain-containing protein [Clostridia bacterium]